MTTVIQHTNYHPAANLFPMMEGEEYAALKADVAKHGLREPIWLHRDGRIIDGRNRAKACAELGITPTTRTYAGTDQELVGFVVSLNLQRRHLNETQKGLVALNVKPLMEQLAAERKAKAQIGNQHAAKKTECADRHTPKVEPVVKTPAKPEPKAPAPPKPARKPEPEKRRAADDAAKMVGTSARTVARVERVIQKAPDLRPAMEAGTLAATRAERIVRDREAEQRRIQAAKEDALKLEIKPTITLHEGDFRETLKHLHGTVDAIITDPPYPREFLPLLNDLATWADQALKPDGILVILMGQTHLPEVYERLQGGRPYRWTGCYYTPGPGYVSHPRRVQSNWKPLLIYGNGARFSDVITSHGTDKDAKNYHEWGQDYGAFHDLVARLTRPGDLIADPFAGSGTTLLAAKAQGRNAIGSELDPEHYATAKRRLA